MALNLSGLPTVPMRIIFLTMFVMVTWATVTDTWLGVPYLMSNYFVILLGIWAEYDKFSAVPVQMFFFGMAFTLLNDIISLGLNFQTMKFRYSHNNYLNTFNFNATCAIILVLVKPVACLFIYKEWTFRVNSDEGAANAPNASNYERLDQGGAGGGSYGGVYGGGKGDQAPPQYQPPGQPFP